MLKFCLNLKMCVILIICAGLWCTAVGYAQQLSGMNGWELESAYNKLYDPMEMDKLKGELLGFKEVKPFPEMAAGIALILKDRDDETVTVHIGPKAYLELHPMGFRKGDKLSIKGAWAEIDNEDVFIASKVKKGDHFEFKVRRTSDGKPFWTMGKEELDRELAGTSP